MKFLQILMFQSLFMFSAFSDIFKFDPAALVYERQFTWGRWDTPYRIYAFEKNGIIFENEPKDWSWKLKSDKFIGLWLDGSFNGGESFKVTTIRADGSKEEFETRTLLEDSRVQAVLDEAKKNNKKLKFALKNRFIKGDRTIEISVLDEERDPDYVTYLLQKASADYMDEVGRIGYSGAKSGVNANESLLEEPISGTRPETRQNSKKHLEK